MLRGLCIFDDVNEILARRLFSLLSFPFFFLALNSPSSSSTNSFCFISEE